MNQSSNWPHIYERQYGNGEVGYVCDLGKIDGKRIRRTYKTPKEAQEFAEQARRDRSKEGELAFRVPIELRLEAAKCCGKLQPYAATLSEAADHYIQHYLVHRTAPPIGEIVQRLLQEKIDGGRRAETIKALRWLHNVFAKQFGARQLHTITLEELKNVCLGQDKSPRTRFNLIRLVKQLYNYANSLGWVATNTARAIPVPVWDPGEPKILTVDENRRLLAQAEQYGLLAFVVLVLFCGVRRTEALRLDWSAINPVDREIIISAQVAKKRSRRVIPINDTAAAWLVLCQQIHGPIVDVTKFPSKFLALRKAAGIENWPKNGLRHSFASYHLAHYKDPVRTAYLMGHRDGTEMLDSHYKGLVRGAAANEFWELRPPPQPTAFPDTDYTANPVAA